MSKVKKINLHKWFPFLHSWHKSDEPKMIAMVKSRLYEIVRAKRIMKSLGLRQRKIERPEPYPFG